MIFITVGTQRFPFYRLFNQLEIILKENNSSIHQYGQVVAQTGSDEILLNGATNRSFITQEDFDHYSKISDLIITHAGTSSIIKCLRLDKKVIVVPRMKELGEHIDNHQFEIARLFKKKNLLEVVTDISQLESAISEIGEMTFEKYKATDSLLLESVKNDLSELLSKKASI